MFAWADDDLAALVVPLAAEVAADIVCGEGGEEGRCNAGRRRAPGLEGAQRALSGQANA